MCYYITGSISGKVTVKELNSVGQEFGLKFETCPNEFVQEQLKSGECYIWKYCDYCDCGTILGSLNKKNVKRREDKIKSEVEKRKRKGWSEAKIQRFLNDKNEGIGQYKSRVETENEILEWIDFCKKLFETTPINTFGILIHWYNGDFSLENEKITLNGRIFIDKSELTTNNLLEIEEDTDRKSVV